MTITWPSALVPQGVDPELRNFRKGGPRSGTGRRQDVYSDAGFWTIDMTLWVRNRRTAFAYRSLIARLRQGEEVDVPIFDKYLVLGATNNSATASLASDAALRATELDLTVSGMDIQAGAHFTLQTRLYRITEVLDGPADPPIENPIATGSPWPEEGYPWTTDVSVSADYTVKVLPPLRSQAIAGAVTHFKDQTCRCTLHEPNSGDLDLDNGRFGEPSLRFIESI